MSDHPLLGIAVIFVLGIGAQWVAWRLRWPAILLLLIAGMLAGPGTAILAQQGWLSGPLLDPTRLLGRLLLPLVSLSVGLILFEGGLTLTLSQIAGAGHVVGKLVTIGAAATWLIATAAARFVLGLPGPLAVLLGAILVVTGPTVIGPLLRHVRPVGQVGPILRWEGIVIDPIGVLLTVLVYQVISADPAALHTFMLREIFTTLAVGLGLGVTGAGVIIVMLRRYWVPDYLQNPVTLMVVAVAFAASNAIQQTFVNLLASSSRRGVWFGCVAGGATYPSMPDQSSCQFEGGGLMRTASRWAYALAIIVGVVLSISNVARAQDVLGNGDFPEDWVFPFAPALSDPATRINQGNVTGASGANFTVGDAHSDVRLKIQATATENGVAPTDRFSFTLGANQDFEVVDANGANLWAPLYLRGAISYFRNAVAPNANFAVGSISASVEFRQFNGVTYVPLNDPTLPAPAAAASILTKTLNSNAEDNFFGSNIDEIAVHSFNNAPAAKYQLRLRLTITGDAGNPLSDVDSGLTVNANQVNANDRYTGAITGLGYAPAQALPDSRSTVNAPAARTAYTVDGTGATIGLLEPGRIIDTHSAFAGKVTQLRQRFDQPAGLTNAADPNTMVADSRSEHATAVGGIAAGNAGNDGQKGIAPGASLLSTSADAYVDDAAGPGAKKSGQKQFDELLAGSTIINMSAVYPALDLPMTYVDQQIHDNPRKSFVKSAGNSGIAAGGANTITNPGMAYNIITVGSVRQDMTRTGAFSSTNNTDGTLRKPDIVAPGDYVIIPNAIDTSADGLVNDFDRRFTGSDGRYHDAPTTTGGASGTSFAAPHVSGTIALMQDYRRRNPATHDADAVDHRVLKAVLLNTANRTAVSHGDGAAWEQKDTTVVGNVVTVKESLDRELGAGLLDTQAALKNFAAGEVRAADNNTDQSFIIKSQTNGDIFRVGGARTEFWDLEHVAASQTGPPPPGGNLLFGTVDYIIGGDTKLNFIAESNTWVGSLTPHFTNLKVTLNWDRTTDATGATYDPLSHVELRLYADGVEDGNKTGFDPDNPAADRLLATTESDVENVKLFDLTPLRGWDAFAVFGSTPPSIWNPKYYIEVVNLSATGLDYGISVTAALVPEPVAGLTALVCVAGLLHRRSRRD